MKKILYSMLALAMATFTFTSCEDVPAPYDDPNSGNGEDDTPTVTITPSGEGTIDSPYNVAAALEYTNALESDVESDKNIYIKGIVTSISENYTTNYGNATFYISDDADATNKFYVFRTLYLGNKKYTSGTQPQIGDEVIICGKVVNYKGNTPETVQNQSYLYSLNGKTSSDDSGSSTTEEILKPVNGTFINETFASSFGVFTVNTVKGTAWVIDYSTAKATGYANSTTTPSKSYLISKPMDMSSTTSATISFEYILRYYTNSGTVKSGVEDKVLITANYTGDPTTTTWTDITGTLTEGSDWTTFSKYSVAVPSEFLGKGQVVLALYYACEDNSATWEVKNLKVVEGNGSETGGDTGGEVSGNTLSVEMSSLGLTNGTALETITLSDGTTLSFDGGGNTNSPKYYDNGTNVRMYPKNTMAVTSSSKTISAIKIVCDVYNNVTCNASGDISSSKGTVNIDDTNVSITGISNSSVVITNTSSTTGAASQIRMKTLVITYTE